MTSRHIKTAKPFLFVIFFVYFSFAFINQAEASIFSNIKNLFFGPEADRSIAPSRVDDNLLRPNLSVFAQTNHSSDLLIDTNSSDTALSVDSGTMRVSTEDEIIFDDKINNYEVKKGDTLDSIAALFNVSKNSIIYANDLKGKTISAGDVLVIFPINGIQYVIKNSGTINDIAKKYKIDANDIATYNGIAVDTKLAKGDVIFIPDAEGEIAEVISPSTKPITKPKIKYSTSVMAGYFMRPVVGCVKTQGLHGHNGVDLGCKVGTSLLASAGGKVITAKASGYNGGYGEMIIISHANGTQTVYGHLSRVDVQVGDTVAQGQIIGATGNTGRSTGPHLHFEIRGAANPF